MLTRSCPSQVSPRSFSSRFLPRPGSLAFSHRPGRGMSVACRDTPSLLLFLRFLANLFSLPRISPKRQHQPNIFEQNGTSRIQHANGPSFNTSAFKFLPDTQTIYTLPFRLSLCPPLLFSSCWFCMTYLITAYSSREPLSILGIPSILLHLS